MAIVLPNKPLAAFIFSGGTSSFIKAWRLGLNIPVKKAIIPDNRTIKNGFVVVASKRTRGARKTSQSIRTFLRLNLSPIGPPKIIPVTKKIKNVDFR